MFQQLFMTVEHPWHTKNNGNNHSFWKDKTIELDFQWTSEPWLASWLSMLLISASSWCNHPTWIRTQRWRISAQQRGWLFGIPCGIATLLKRLQSTWPPTSYIKITISTYSTLGRILLLHQWPMSSERSCEWKAYNHAAKRPQGVHAGGITLSDALSNPAALSHVSCELICRKSACAVHSMTNSSDQIKLGKLVYHWAKLGFVVDIPRFLVLSFEWALTHNEKQSQK